MLSIPSLRPVTVDKVFPNVAARRPQTGILLVVDEAAVALRVKVAMEKAVTAMGPRRMDIDQAIMMVATDKKEEIGL